MNWKPGGHSFKSLIERYDSLLVFIVFGVMAVAAVIIFLAMHQREGESLKGQCAQYAFDSNGDRKCICWATEYCAQKLRGR